MSFSGQVNATAEITITRLDNGAHVVTVADGHRPNSPYGPVSERHGFATYAEAERFAVRTLRAKLRAFNELPHPVKVK
jgi:hypothetical protein